MCPISPKSGFSLVELMIVVVVIAVLVGIAVPIYQKNLENAKRTEAMAGIGSIRRALQIEYAIEGSYPIANSYTRVVGQSWNSIKPGELTGKYFKDKNFKYLCTDGISYRIRCQKAGVLEKNVWIDETGRWKFDTDVIAGDEE